MYVQQQQALLPCSTLDKQVHKKVPSEKGTLKQHAPDLQPNLQQPS